jgi:hypothetical protein
MYLDDRLKRHRVRRQVRDTERHGVELFAGEAMMVGRPVVALYPRQRLRKRPIRLASRSTDHTGDAGTLATVLRGVLTGGPERLLLKGGRRSRRFAERYHDPVVVVRHVIADLDLPTRAHDDP